MKGNLEQVVKNPLKVIENAAKQTFRFLYDKAIPLITGLTMLSSPALALANSDYNLPSAGDIALKISKVDGQSVMKVMGSIGKGEHTLSESLNRDLDNINYNLKSEGYDVLYLGAAGARRTFISNISENLSSATFSNIHKVKPGDTYSYWLGCIDKGNGILYVVPIESKVKTKQPKSKPAPKISKIESITLESITPELIISESIIPSYEEATINRGGMRLIDLKKYDETFYSFFIGDYHNLDPENANNTKLNFEFNKLIYGNNIFDLRFEAKPELIAKRKGSKAKVELNLGAYNDYIGARIGLVGEEPTSHVFGGLRAGVGTEHISIAAGFDFASSDKLDKMLRTYFDFYRESGDDFEFTINAGSGFDGISYAKTEFKFGSNEGTQFGIVLGGKSDIKSKEIYQNDPNTSYYWQNTTFGAGFSVDVNKYGFEFYLFPSVRFTGDDTKPVSINGIEFEAHYTPKNSNN